jgi:inosine-uridine nucleoside N-ribohydrolase
MEAYLRQTGETGISLPDPVAMGILLDRSLCLQSSPHYIEVETQSSLTRGMTVVDRLNVAADPRNRSTWSEALNNGTKATICWELDVARWKALLFDALR